MKKFLGAIFALLLVSSASAEPIISATVTLVGPNTWAFDVFVDETEPDDQYKTYFFQDLVFSNANGILQSVRTTGSGTIDINTDADAATFDGFQGYNAAQDSYFKFPATAQVLYYLQTPTTYGITSGTGGYSYPTLAPVARILAHGPLNFSGEIARAYGSTPVNGTLAVPEPGGWLLASMGLAALGLWRRIRRPGNA